MGTSSDRPGGPSRDPGSTTLIPRRRVLVLMGAGAVAMSGGLGSALAGCAGPPVTVALDVDVESLVVGTPTEVPFTVGTGSSAVVSTTWLVKQADGNLIAFDPRCTHALCAYAWSTETARFECHCHEGRFALDGTVLSGPPPRALDRFPVRQTPAGVEIDVPAAFEAPRESLPA
jgi:Rieske Fe-S protein